MKGLWALFLISAAFAERGFQEPWGKDSALVVKMAPVDKKNDSIPARIANALIDFHQKVISPVDGPRSHYRPSSSQYMRLAIQNYGFLKGFIMGCDRLIRENDEMWVYRTIDVDGQVFKYDPATVNKFE